MPKLKPLFIWAGGKTKMLKYHSPHLPSTVNSYSEPFFGGGAMFLHVMQKYNPDRAYINDINESIVNIYRTVKKCPDEFCNVVNVFQTKYISLSKEDRKKYFFEVRHAHAYDYTSWSKEFEAGVLYFLMKTGFNGIWQINKNTNGRYGTPAGLLNQKDVVYDKATVYAWHELLQNVEIYCGDYKDCPTGDLNYFDPPYRDSFTKYGTSWGDTETEELIEHAKSIDGHVLLCNRCDGSTFFDDRKGDLNITRFPVTYTAGRRKKTSTGYAAKPATEILLYS
jgi:DNA adenine methylase